MNRRTLIKSAGLAGIASLVPFRSSEASQLALAKMRKDVLLPEAGCILIPQETVGPYPGQDTQGGSILSPNSSVYRQDIRETRTGLPLNLTLSVVNINDNCNPVLNAAVHIWHCDKDGNYSDYNNFVGQKFLRGIQLTDATGQAKFKTIYPGWYPGRTTHIHFQIFLSSHLSATSQFAFPEASNIDVYNSPLYSSRGQKDTSNTTDGVFSDGIAYELASISGSTNSEIEGVFTIGVAVPASGVIKLEPETGGQFKLGQNYPNPFTEMTTIPFTLTNPSNVTVEIFDVNGKKIVEVINRRMGSGEQQVAIGKLMNGVLLSAGGYVYQLTVENTNGVFRQCKMLTVL